MIDEIINLEKNMLHRIIDYMLDEAYKSELVDTGMHLARIKESAIEFDKKNQTTFAICNDFEYDTIEEWKKHRILEIIREINCLDQ